MEILSQKGSADMPNTNLSDCQLNPDTNKAQKIADLMAMPGLQDIELEIPQLRDLAQAADFSSCS